VDLGREFSKEGTAAVLDSDTFSEVIGELGRLLRDDVIV
jgi:hypothetical protein